MRIPDAEMDKKMTLLISQRLSKHFAVVRFAMPRLTAAQRARAYGMLEAGRRTRVFSTLLNKPFEHYEDATHRLGVYRV